MGVYDPKKDEDVSLDQATKAQAQPVDPLDDQFRSAISSINDFTANSVQRLFDLSRKMVGMGAPYTFFGDLEGTTSPLFNSFKSWYGTQGRPDGYVAYPVPATAAYADCKDKAGLAAWDTRGYWHCIFPSAQIPPSDIGQPGVVTKEDVDADTDHSKYGLLFENFNDLMDWRVKMKDVIQQKEDEAIDEFNQAERGRWGFSGTSSAPTTPAPTASNGDIYSIPSSKTQGMVQDKDKTYVQTSGSSTQVQRTMLDNGDVEQITHVKHLYPDGTSDEKTTKQIIDGKTGETRDVDVPARKGGWFWGKDK